MPLKSHAQAPRVADIAPLVPGVEVATEVGLQFDQDHAPPPVLQFVQRGFVKDVIGHQDDISGIDDPVEIVQHRQGNDIMGTVNGEPYPFRLAGGYLRMRHGQDLAQAEVRAVEQYAVDLGFIFGKTVIDQDLADHGGQRRCPEFFTGIFLPVQHANAMQGFFQEDPAIAPVKSN